MTNATLTQVNEQPQVSRTPAGMLATILSTLLWWIAQAGLWFFFITVAFPLLWTLITSFKESRELFTNPWGLPAAVQWDNYVRAWDKMHVGTYLFNSIYVGAMSLFFIMLLGSMAAYVLSRFLFPGNRVLYFYFVAGWLIPGMLTFIPAWFLHRRLGTLDTPWALIIQYTAGSLPFTVFFLHSFFGTLPKELEESAIIDGASLYQVFFLVMLPLARSGLLTVGIFNFLGVWNEYFWALVTISRDAYKTLPLGMANVLQQSQYATDWGAMFAGFIIMLVPTFIIYAIFQRRLTEGITVGAIKG